MFVQSAIPQFGGTGQGKHLHGSDNKYDYIAAVTVIGKKCFQITWAALASCKWFCDKYLMMYIVAIGNPERHVRKASHRGSKQQ